MVGAFWFAVAKYSSYPWFHRVPTDSNCADGISRSDFTIPEKLGWQYLDIKWAFVYEELARYVVAGVFDPCPLIETLDEYLQAQLLVFAR